MPDLTVQNKSLPIEAIKPLKANFKMDDDLMAQLKNDGLDEVIFQKGDQVYIAYKKNLDLSDIKTNSDAFNPETANQIGQMFQDGEAVKVLFVDDEDKGSFWLQPYKAVTNILDKPWMKAGLLGLAAGTVSGVFRQTEMGHTIKSGEQVFSTLGRGVAIGTGVGAGAGAMRYMAEVWNTGTGNPSDFPPEVTVAASGVAGFLGGHLVGAGLHNAAKHLMENPKVAAAIGIGAVATVGTGLVIDALSNNKKVANYTVINRIAQK